MIKKAIACLLLAGLSAAVAAQTITPERKNVRYVGIQANQLLRQLFNFSNNAGTFNNPYLLTFAVNRDSVGPGLNIGFGYSFDETKTGDAVLERISKINNLALRIGYEHKYRLGKKFITSIGIDAVIDRQKNNTESKTLNDFNKSTVTTTNKENGIGFGPRFTLNYQIMDRLLIGTEGTYYFKSIKNTNKTVSKITTREFDPVTGQERNVTHTDVTDSDDDFKKLQLNVPAVIFLILKF
jgi:hypothetical protein